MAARIVTVQSLIDDIRVQSGLRNNQLFSDNQIASLATDAQAELGDIFINAYEHYFQTSYSFTLASNVSTVNLPADFQKDNSLTLNPNTSSPETVPTLGSWLERNQGNGSLWCASGSGRRYTIVGDILEIFPSNLAAGDYLLYYTPQVLGLATPVNPGYSQYVNQFTFSTSDTYTSLGAGQGLFFCLNGNFNPGDVGASFVATVSAPNGSLSGTYPVVSTVGTNSAIVSGAPAFSPTPPIVGSVSVFAPSVNATTKVLSFQGGNFNSEYVGASVTIANASHAGNNGTWIVSAVPGTHYLTVVDTGNALVTETFGANVTVSIQPQGTRPTIPQSMVPWVQYLKTHASIAIRDSRQQDSSELQAKLAALKTRVVTSVKNRTEAPRQAPDMRGRYGNGLGRGWGW